jgi:hypothetical protein
MVNPIIYQLLLIYNMISKKLHISAINIKSNWLNGSKWMLFIKINSSNFKGKFNN